MKSLRGLEGTNIQIVLPGMDRTEIQEVKLRKVEDAGIWIESQRMTNDILKVLAQNSSTHTPVFFVPWHGVTLILSTTEGVSLSEKSFGL